MACLGRACGRVSPVPASRPRAIVLRPTWWRRFLASAALALLGAAPGCARAPAVPAAALRVVDDAGDTVALARPATRIASLVPATTELLFAIGAGAQLAGRSAWCDYPAQAAAVPSLGDGIAPNVEAIVAARPDLVLLYDSPQNAGAAERLRGLGVAVARLRTDRLADVARHARLLGTLTGHAADADTMVRRFEGELAQFPPTADPAAPAVFFLVWDQPPTTIGAGSFLSDLVARAGARNLFADLAAPSPIVSVEAVAARDPALVFWVGESEPAFVSRPEWQVVRAVRERRLLRVSGSEFNRPSPRAPAAIAKLRAALEARR